LESCFYLIHFGQVNGIFGKFGRHLGKNAKMVLDLCFDFRGHFLWSFLSGKLGKFGQKSFSPPNTLSATPPINSYEIKQHGYAQKGLKIFALASEN